mgnify:FL=1
MVSPARCLSVPVVLTPATVHQDRDHLRRHLRLCDTEADRLLRLSELQGQGERQVRVRRGRVRSEQVR